MPNGSHMTDAELDHIASGIRPSWELDDAPFRPGGLASPELEALLAGNAVSHSHTNGAGQFASPITGQRVVSLNAEPEDMLTRVDPVPPAPVLEEAPIAPVRVEAAAAALLPAPQFVAQAAPQAAAQPAPAPQSNRPPPPVNVASSRPPPPSPRNGASAVQADPFAAPVEKAKSKAVRAKSTSSADFPAIKKSNKGLYIALGGGVVALIVAAVAFTSSGKSDAKTIAASPTATQMPGTSTTHEIPPPPATDDLPAATQAAATTQPAATGAPSATQTAAPTATQVAQVATSTAAPTHAAHNDSPPAATHHSSSPPHSNPPASGGSGKGKGGIVRDVPF